MAVHAAVSDALHSDVREVVAKTELCYSGCVCLQVDWVCLLLRP